ncbi:MAG: UDP-N-acetylmuramoyl-L-alanine--D-glutamate ligase [Planctomycetes bacterium]|nr:UDP-N-acetylmuramoyl-L-alanine--D-glutamate ligase [Planctomycetota bacterium]
MAVGEGPLAGKKVTVVGLGRFGGGTGVTRWLCSQGAAVTVSDKADAKALAEPVKALAGLPVTFHLGGHESDDFLKADLLVVNPAVPKDMPLLRQAAEVLVPRTSEINLFIQRCASPIVGITGSVGKSTTTAMAGEILARKFTVHVGGNIGRSLLEELPAIRPDHVVVLELSSFQLEDLPLIGVSPRVAVITNLLPNHLDRHGTMDAYESAKANMLRFQGHDDVLILNRDCPATAGWAAMAKDRVDYFSLSDPPFELRLPGRHNQANAQAAWAIARQFGVARDQAAAALVGFSGLPHRLQFVAEIAGLRFYNDSKCTTPQGAIVALEAFEPSRVVLIAGGYDKHVSFDDLGRVIASRAKALVAIGSTRTQLIDATRKVISASAGQGPLIVEAADLPEAVKKAAEIAKPGDAVLLSPACASYDMFTNYEHRGEVFVELVKSKDFRCE